MQEFHLYIGIGKQRKRKGYGSRNRYDQTPCSWNDDSDTYDSCRGCPPNRPYGKAGPKGRNGKTPPVGDRYVQSPKRRYYAESPGTDIVDVDEPISPHNNNNNNDGINDKPNNVPFDKDPITPITPIQVHEPKGSGSELEAWIADNLNELMHYILFFAIVGLLVMVYHQLRKKKKNYAFVDNEDVEVEVEQDKLV